MDLLAVSLVFLSLQSSQADIWLTINEQNVSSFSTNDKTRISLTLMCHQSIYPERITSWFDRLRSISRRTFAVRKNDSERLEEVWIPTYAMTDFGPRIYFNSIRATIANRLQMTQYYLAIGYTIFAPIVSDSGIYRCQGGINTKGNVTQEVSQTVTLDVTRDSDPTTIITILQKNSPVIEVQEEYGLPIRCHTFIPDVQTTVLYHLVYKAQNVIQITRGSLYETTTDWMEIFNINKTIFNSAAVYKRVSNNALISGFNLPSTEHSDTGLYFCSAVCRTRDKGLLTINSSTVFLDARGNPEISLTIFAPGIPDGTFCRFDDRSLVNTHLCTAKEDYLTVSCGYSAFDFVPYVQLMAGTESSQYDQHYLFDSKEPSSNGVSGPFKSTYIDGVKFMKFYVSQICNFPEVSCSAKLFGSETRIRRRTVIMMSNYCGNKQGQFLKSKGHIIDRTRSMIFICFTAVVLRQQYYAEQLD